MYVNQSVFILFYVKRKKMTADGKAPVYVRLTIDGLQEEMSLAIKIHPDHWDNAQKNVLPGDPAYKTLNKKIGQVKSDLERHFDLVQAQYEIATPQAVFTAYKMPRRGVKVKEEKIRNLAFSESLDKLIREYLGYHSKYVDAHKHGRIPAQPRAELLEREKKRLDQAIEKMAKDATVIFDDKSWTKTHMLAVDEHLLHFLQLAAVGHRSPNTLEKMFGRKRRFIEFLEYRYKSIDTAPKLFGEKLIATGTAAAGNNGKLINFINRLENKLTDKRLQFLLGEKSANITFEETLERLLGYTPSANSNVTVIDLSGVPFDVLSITVSLISRLIFEYGYFYKRLRFSKDPNERINNDVPILLVYEEAHKYVPNSELSKYRSSKQSIERIAKEGRKYGVTLLLASQRPSEISETIFSQCNNFIAMRLTNPVDQGYVKKLLPDTLGSIIDKMTSFKQGEALLVGESIILPSIVQIDRCAPEPSSNDIAYWELWKEAWKGLNFIELKSEWYK